MVCKALVQTPGMPRLLLEALHVCVLAAFAEGTVLMQIRAVVLDPRRKLLWLWRENRAWRAPSELLACPILPVILIIQMHAFGTSMPTSCEVAIFLETCVPRIPAALI
mmetsp:Transcript_82820/g.160041  ORF Transcript_82820/g.160041 Transcript_82820/m.160041 type:complete len:108 (+) Transcript_82820:1147-1470(+)